MGYHKNFADDLVYGGIEIDVHYQQHVTIAVQKIVACSTACGYVPQYDYKASLTGCLTDTHFITELYTIMVGHICMVMCYLYCMIQ